MTWRVGGESRSVSGSYRGCDGDRRRRGIPVRRRRGARSRPANRARRAAHVWFAEQSPTVQGAVTAARLAAVLASADRSAGRGDELRAWKHAAGRPKTARAIEGVCYAGDERRANRRPAPRGLRRTSAALQIGSHAVRSQRCHTADPILGGTPRRSIPARRAGCV